MNGEWFCIQKESKHSSFQNQTNDSQVGARMVERSNASVLDRRGRGSGPGSRQRLVNFFYFSQFSTRLWYKGARTAFIRHLPLCDVGEMVERGSGEKHGRIAGEPCLRHEKRRSRFVSKTIKWSTPITERLGEKN